MEPEYNLIWDRILGLNLFPPELAERGWRSTGEPTGSGCRSILRAHYTKLDWLVWTACLTGRQEDFDALIAPVADWLNGTPDRVPLSDWFDTNTGKQTAVGGFRARPVVGGTFIKLLLDREAGRA